MFQTPETKGVLSALLIPQERFWHGEGITADFNHVMDHQELGYSACLFANGWRGAVRLSLKCKAREEEGG